MRWYADLAWLGGKRADPGVLIETDGERVRAVTIGIPNRPADAVHLPGLTLPGLANAHSHAFHRALRGRAQRGRGTFWSWREQMYAVAARLDPDSYYLLARAVYAEMALAGMTCVGEFHYLHHGPGGTPYGDPNAMGHALIAAAHDAGIRITLLDACYLAGGIGEPLTEPQLRFSDDRADRWATRVSLLKLDRHARVGAAIHSVRAVPADAFGWIVGWAADQGTPLHFHLSEQPDENAACAAAYGRTPAQLLAEHGVLGPRSSAVHATHVSTADVALLGSSRTTVCLCPTTERDLADGIGPARALANAGSQLTVGSDSHAVTDVFEEARAVEFGERLVTRTRGHWTSTELLHAATEAGHASLGWTDAGRIEAGALADFVTLRLDSVRTAGAEPSTVLDTAIFAAAAADVREVVVGGRHIVANGRHTLIADVPAALQVSIETVTRS